MDYVKMKSAIDTETARAGFQKRSVMELDGMIQFLRQQIVDAEWDIARAKASIEAYQGVIDSITESRDPK